jgi:hypothetical protein
VRRVNSKWGWEKIWDGTDNHCHCQIWVCRQDLKDAFVIEAQKAFGKCLEQVVRLGAYPQILYPSVESTINECSQRIRE